MRESAAVRSAYKTAAAIATLALIAGCGGGSTAVNKDQLIVKGDAICQEGQKRFSEIQAAPATTAKLAADQTAKLIESANAEIGQLKKLNPPAEEKSKFDAYITAREQVLTYFHQGLDAAKHNRDQGFAAAKTKVAEGGPGRLKLAQAVGFKKCSQPTAGLPGGSG